MSKFKKISDNDLSELLTMTYQMIDKLDYFKHVSGHFPQGIKTSLQKYYESLCKEQERRENLE